MAQVSGRTRSWTQAICLQKQHPWAPHPTACLIPVLCWMKLLVSHPILFERGENTWFPVFWNSWWKTRPLVVKISSGIYSQRWVPPGVNLLLHVPCKLQLPRCVPSTDQVPVSFWKVGEILDNLELWSSLWGIFNLDKIIHLKGHPWKERIPNLSETME